jgi:hypothetical protein
LNGPNVVALYCAAKTLRARNCRPTGLVGEACAWQAQAVSRRHPGLLLFAACLAALVLRLMVPAGWMPVASGFALTLCSGTTLPAEPLQPAGDGDSPCDYALAIGPALLSAALALPLLALPLRPAPWPHAARAAMRRHRARPPGQGPPRT